MSSRRITTRPSLGYGRSRSVDEISASSRPGSCSYLSNVRPGNRSTLCSVMAQLTEETQPFFEQTLKSKAVSESCNVKFSCVVTGHPTPQVLWYKDDMQLDRFCGLPKYEVFRNGQNHSLHIYNCTVDDAAIYQASASNTKGIVSCSGVLEVGGMNEFKIHQRYFGKLKQKAENKRREAEGKENQEPLRTISPDRTQRKRRSTMEAFLSAPSSTEDEGNDLSPQAVPVEPEARLQEATVEKVEEKPTTIVNGSVSAVTNGQAINENINKSGTYMYDSTQKIFTPHKPKTPFVKKKLKISSNLKVAKPDTPGEMTTEEKRAVMSTTRLPKEPTQLKGNSEEIMEVENVVPSSVMDLDFKNVKKQSQKSDTVEVLPNTRIAEKPSEKRSVSTHKEHHASLVTAAVTSTTGSGTKGKQAVKHEKSPLSKDREEKMEKQKTSPPFNSTQLKQSAAELKHQTRKKVKEDSSKTAQISPMDVDEKSSTSTHGQSVNAPCETVLPPRPCEQAAHQLSETETSPCQKNVSVSGPGLLSEVTRTHTKTSRNDTPVILELPPNQSTMDVQPTQKTPSVKKMTADDIQTYLLGGVPQAASDKMTKDTQDHSRGSNEIHTVLYTEQQKSSTQSPGHAENSKGSNVPPCTKQSQDDTAIKAVKSTETQVNGKVESHEVHRLPVQTNRSAPKERVDKMETEIAAPDKTEPKQKEKITEKIKEAAEKQTDVIVNSVCKESKTKVLIKKEKEESPSEIHNLNPAIPLQTKTQEKTSVRQPPSHEFQEIQKPITTVVSIAELLRAQIKALESTLESSLNTVPFHADHVQSPPASDTCEEDGNSKPKVKKSVFDRGTDSYFAPLRNIKETLMEVYHQLSKTDQETISHQVETLPPAQKLIVIPPMSAEETGTTLETAGPHSSAREYNECTMDICPETKASAPKHSPDVTLAEREGVVVPPLPSKEEEIYRSVSKLSESVTEEPETPLTVTPIKAQGSNITDLENAKDESVLSMGMEVTQKLTPEIKLGSISERGISEVTLLNQHKMEDHDAKNSSPQTFLNVPKDSLLLTNAQEKDTQLISEAVDFSSRTDSPARPTPEASPSSKRRNCVSPIPSATPQELASGARRKIAIPKANSEDTLASTSPGDSQSPKKEVSTQSSRLSPSPVTLSTSPSLSRRSPLPQPPAEPVSPAERSSPLFSRKKLAPETQTTTLQPSLEIQTPKTEGKPAEKDKRDPFKAPQVIRKIRAETYADASGHLKLWCQFFNVLGESTINWYKNEDKIAKVMRSAGDETQVNLAIVQASRKDSGVYGCTITNEYGTDSTDYLLSADLLAGLSLREDLGVGEEIEMTPMIFNRGVADHGVWGNKFFGRVMMQESQVGEGCSHKVWRAKVIYGLEPVFESGNTCIIKVRNPIAYGGKGESCLIDRNLEIIKQECKIQNLVREYCKIFSAEVRVIEHFGPCLEVIPVYLMYRPANTVPYNTVEAELTGDYQKYSVLDHTGRLHMKTGTEMERKCCTLQHWIYQWTNGNLLFTRLEGADTKITNVGISVKTSGHLGLSVEGNPKVFEHFASQHQCNYFCGLLGLKSLKVIDSLLTPGKPKGSRSPLLQRKTTAGSSSPQTVRKAAGSPRIPRKTEQESRNTSSQQTAAETPKVVQME